MPRAWQRVARNRTAEESLSKAWKDLTVSPHHGKSSAFHFRKTTRPLQLESWAMPEVSSDTDCWRPAAPSAKLASQPVQPAAREVILPGLPPDFDNETVEGPMIDRLDRSVVESLPDVTSQGSNEGPAEAALVAIEPLETEPGWKELRLVPLVACRSTPRREPVPPVETDQRSSLSPSESNEPKEGKSGSIWCPPESLYAQLAELLKNEETAAWAKQAEHELRHLGEIVDDRPKLVPTSYARLREMVAQTGSLATRLKDPALATRLRRAGYALQRRLDVWQYVLPPFDSPSDVPEVDLSRFQLALSDVDVLIQGSAHGQAWHEYLLLDAIQEASRNNDPTDPARRKALARRILGRVAVAPLTESQRDFLAKEPLDRLAGELRRMAAAPPDRADLLDALEQYERTGRASDARRLADDLLWLGIRSEGPAKDLHRSMAMHYRNANLRMVLSESLLNRLIPERLPEYQHVRDTILGNPVQGESLTATEVGIRLIPDSHRIRLALEITGEVAALTSSNNGPAIFQNSSESRYTVRKPMELTVGGLTLWPSEVQDVTNRTRLRRLQTTFDGVPLVGALIQNVARTQHDMKRSEVRREIERKVAQRAKQRIDEEADARLTDFSKRLEAKILEPMQGMALGPRMVDAGTTKDRLTMRLRVASPRQLGAHTPRPMAPGNSLASFQVHQSVLNNLVEQLALDGKTFTLPELRSRLARRLHRPELEQRSTNHDDVVITFAEKDAVRVLCEDGRITIHLAIARLRESPRTWKNFEVRVHYSPRVDGLSAELVRDGRVQLPGRRVRTSAQFALRGIFSKIFSKNGTRELVPDRIRNHPKMDDLAVTQMTIEDGWIAVAVGPKPRVARAAGSSSPK
ncbi:MAG: hypothetical protein JW888_17520 [Pirellulales bacterium]|nr:hypothetical protein [Pirellulales bacterium]